MAEETKKNKDKNRFFKDFKAELKKVIWPTPKQIINNTIAVVTIVVVTAIIVLILDLAFEAMNKYGINRLRNLVPESQSIVETVDDSENNNELNSNENADTIEDSSVENNSIEESNEAQNIVQE